MTKDRMKIRKSMKHAHGAAAVEDAVGITELRTIHRCGTGAEEERGLRLTGLMKWSFDDFIVQEVWPDGFLSQVEEKGVRKETATAFVLRVISEGIPDTAIAAFIEGRCPHRVSLQFLTPLDFTSSQERFVLLLSPSQEARHVFRHEQKVHLAEGVVCFGKAMEIPVEENAAPSLPIHLLPDLRYSIVLRGMRGSLADVLPRLEGLKKNGFLNYSHLARHGVGLFRAFESGRHLLQRDYVEFLRGHVLGLTERSPTLRKEIPSLLEIIADPKSTRRDWASVKQGLEHALKEDDALIHRAQTGLYYPHHMLLRDFLERASNIAPKSHNSAQLIRECIPRLLLQEKIRSVADAHFNALASLRWKMHGNQVALGDLVILDEEKGPLDLFEAPADHMNGEMTSVHHPEWLSIAGEKHMNHLRGKIHVVQTPEEGRRFSLEQVVLPVLGNGAERLVSPDGKMREASERLAQELQIEGLMKMKAAPPATYRRLVVRPRDFTYCLFDDERGWCWESNNDAPIRPQLWEDQEGIMRQLSPLSVATGKNIIARNGIRGAEQRSHFLKAARRSGMTCVLRMTLPRGSAVTSALREAFQFATLDPGAIFHLLRIRPPMVVVRLGLRLRFTKVPGVQGERVFRDTMTVADPNDHGYQDINDIVEKKLRFMDIPPSDFTVFHRDSKTGDTLVVDDAYWGELLTGLVEAAAATTTEARREASRVDGGDGNEDGDDDFIVERAISFDVEVLRERPLERQLHGEAAVNVLPLTSETLQACTTAGVRLAIAALTCPPRYPNFFIRGVVIAIRFKTPKPNVSVCEIDLCDAEDPQQQITLMTFDASVQKAVRDNLRGDRRQVVELRHVYIRLKNEIDRRFQTNTHPLLIRMDRGSRVEVVQVLPLPVTPRSERVVTVRENLQPTGLVNLSDLAAARDPYNAQSIPAVSKVQSSLGSSSSSSSIHSGARRTMLSLSSGISPSGTPVSGVVPSQLGEQIRRQQTQFLSKRVREDPMRWGEPDTIHVTARDVRMRDPIMVHEALQEENKKYRILRRKEVSQTCIICGVNCEDESTLRVVVDLLKNNTRNMGRHIPTMAELRQALSDRRRTKDGKTRERLTCSEHFVDLRTRTVHVVHCRCAHLCTSYQRGAELEDVVFCELPMQTCDLCGMPGASVSCYHPDCHERYHTVCALFSGGYVNFGKKDPYLPCPACPRHTQVVVTASKKTPLLNGQDASSWWEEDEVVFDSRVVEDTDLRDPDENDGA